MDRSRNSEPTTRHGRPNGRYSARPGKRLVSPCAARLCGVPVRDLATESHPGVSEPRLSAVTWFDGSAHPDHKSGGQHYLRCRAGQRAGSSPGAMILPHSQGHEPAPGERGSTARPRRRCDEQGVRRRDRRDRPPHVEPAFSIVGPARRPAGRCTYGLVLSVKGG